MLAYVLIKNDRADNSFELREVPKPDLTEGHVRIKVTAFGLNYADIMCRHGQYRECPPLPAIIGYDVEGEIDDVAPGITSFKKGDRVFALTRFGGYAQYVSTAVEGVGHLDSKANAGEGCALATQCVTAYHATIHCQTLMKGEKILIHAAAGGLGTALIQLALWKGCTVIGVAGGKSKTDYLAGLGVQHIVDHQTTSYLDYVRDHLNGRVDVVIDNLGGSSIKKAKTILGRGGRIISLGAASISGKKSKLSLIKLVLGFGWFSPIGFLTRSQSLIGINMLKIADHRKDIIAHAFLEVQKLYEQGILKPHVGRIFNQDQLSDAHAFMEDRKSIGKVVVKWN